MSVSLSKAQKGMSRKSSKEDLAVAANIKNLRKKQNVSQQEMSKALGISFQQFQKYEKGQNRISASRLVEISRFLNTTPHYLLGWSSEQTEAELFNHKILSLWRGIRSERLRKVLLLLMREISKQKKEFPSKGESRNA